MYSPFWNPSCPQGGQFYACGNGTEFVGCCDNVNPCMESHGCSADDLRQTSFERSEYGKFKDQQCSYGDFYTCKMTQPDAFFGCCSVNACEHNGCPDIYFFAALLSNDPMNATDMDPYPPVDGASSSTSSSVSSSTMSPTSSETSAATSGTVTSQARSRSIPMGAIAGSAVGGFALLCAVVAVVWFVCRHTRKSSEKHNTGSKDNTYTPSALAGADGDIAQDKPPTAEISSVISPYQDFSSTVPPYSNSTTLTSHYHSGAWSTQSAQPQGHEPFRSVYGTASRSQYRPYSPHHSQVSEPSLYRPQARFPPASSEISDPTQSASRNNSLTALPSRTPVVSQCSSQGFTREYQGPPQELGGENYVEDTQKIPELGVHHVGDRSGHFSEIPRVELDVKADNVT